MVERAMPTLLMRSLIRRTLMVLFMDVLLRVKVGFCSVDNPLSNFLVIFPPADEGGTGVPMASQGVATLEK